MTNTLVELEDEQVERLRALSSASAKSVDQLVRESVDQLLAQDAAARRWQRAWEAVGSAQDAEERTDVARQHDVYLARAYSRG